MCSCISCFCSCMMVKQVFSSRIQGIFIKYSAAGVTQSKLCAILLPDLLVASQLLHLDISRILSANSIDAESQIDEDFMAQFSEFEAALLSARLEALTDFIKQQNKEYAVFSGIDLALKLTTDKQTDYGQHRYIDSSAGYLSDNAGKMDCEVEAVADTEFSMVYFWLISVRI
ncbi:hypothetical protein BZA70DRAFT_5707 [Myxozyma melibiosi]|uniref:Uncharacterized protein n=1 Tax=Myxozyma melibiosi TaxID=54550 RepID=A0ABR1FBE1_9ASCO